MNTKHTPGPWIHDPIDYRKSEVPYLRAGDKILAIFCLSDGKTPAVQLQDESEANAKLIAAAPELLEAVEVALWDLENGEAEAQKQGKPRLAERLEIFRAAIKKAIS